MPLTCGCDYEPSPGDICWYPPQDYSTLPGTRKKRCASCETPITPGDIVTTFIRFKVPDSEIEDRIYGEEGEIPRASHFHCEKCADMWFSLQELGFNCLNPDENMYNVTDDYAELYGSNSVRPKEQTSS